MIEKILNAGFESVIQERVFKPLGMTSTTYLWRQDANNRLVAGHNPDLMYNLSQT